MRIRLALLCLAVVASSCARPRGSTSAASVRGAYRDPASAAMRVRAPARFEARFETTQGTFVVHVHRDWVPIGADRFYDLARSGYFDDQRFFRVRAGYIAQFGLHGDPRVIAAWKHQTIRDDSVRVSNVRGTLAYAMTGPDTRTTQIYVNLADNTQLDRQGFAPFGAVVSGMDVVDRLYAGYGESAGGGVRGGRQGPIEAGGNVYLDRDFPKLDRIVRVLIQPAS